MCGFVLGVVSASGIRRLLSRSRARSADSLSRGALRALLAEKEKEIERLSLLFQHFVNAPIVVKVFTE